MKRIMFVDDEPNVLMGLQRMLRSMRSEWDMTFVNSGEEALTILDNQTFDVVVSDMRMPGMNGAQLLSEVCRTHPGIGRIILSGQSDHEAILHSIGPTHRYLSKPCDTELLKTTVMRTCDLRDILASKPLRKLVSGMTVLPSPPACYNEIKSALETPDISMKQVAEIISRDAGMTAKILQLVNSAFFGIPRHVSNASQAISIIGLDTVKTLALSFHIFGELTDSRVPPEFIDSLWRHSVKVGKYAKQIAHAQNLHREECEAAFTAGLLHDIGKLVFMTNFPVQYVKILNRAEEEKAAVSLVEFSLFETTHAEAGAYLMGLWGLPDSVVEAITWHHNPSKLGGIEFGLLTAVHAANAIAYEDAKIRSFLIDQSYLASLGISDRLLEWQKICKGIDQ